MTGRLLILAVLLIAACGKDGDTAAVGPDAASACSATYNGTWLGANGTKLQLNANCTITMIGSPYCQSDGTYSALLGSSGAMTIEITNTTGGTCPGLSRFQCSYIVSVGLSLDCGGGTVGYSKVTE